MTGKRERNPAPEMSFKRSNFVMTVAMFYKRPITAEDVAEINPTWGGHRDKVKRVFQRLVSHGYLVKVPAGYAMTQYGATQIVEYGRWRAKSQRNRNLPD